MTQSYEHRKLTADPGARTTPDDVFQYANVDAWRNRVWNMLGDLITEDVKVEFQHNHPEYITSDDLSWLDDIIFDVTGAVSDIKTTAADRLSVEFTAFRAALGCGAPWKGAFSLRVRIPPNNCRFGW